MNRELAQGLSPELHCALQPLLDEIESFSERIREYSEGSAFDWSVNTGSRFCRDAELGKSQPWPPFEKRNKAAIITTTKVSPSISRA
jgi:hypothetical protein